MQHSQSKQRRDSENSQSNKSKNNPSNHAEKSNGKINKTNAVTGKSKDKKTLFDDEEMEEGQVQLKSQQAKGKAQKSNNEINDDSQGFTINQEFAKRFEHNKRRELLEKGRQVYGEKALEDNGNEEEQSEEESEDEEAELINPRFESKFLETIAMIRNNDPKLKDIKDELFQDDDFEEDDVNLAKASTSKKKLTYKDQIRQDALRRGAASESEDSDDSEVAASLFKKRGQKETLAEEEERLKNEFKKAAKVKSKAAKMLIADEEEDI